MKVPPSLAKGQKKENGNGKGRFFSEIHGFKLDSLKEETIGGRKVSTFSGISQLADAPNQNGRVYPLSLFESVFRKPDFTGKLENRQLVGMLGHPSDGVVDPSKISHVTTEVKILHDQRTPDGHVPVWTKNEILETPEGKVLKTLFQSGIRLGVSSRGWGDSYMEGSHEVMEDDFDLCGWDVVVEPSVAIAFPEAEIVESFNRNAKSFKRRVEDRLRAGASKEERRAYREIVENLCTSGACQIDPSTRSALESLRTTLKGAPSKKTGGKNTMPTTKAQDRLSRIEAAVAKKQSQLEGQNAKLQSANKALSEAVGESRKKLESADRLMKGLLAKNRERDQRYEAAKKLLDAAIRRARLEARRAKQAETRLQAAEALINESVRKGRTEGKDRLASHVEGLVRKFPLAQRGSAKTLLAEAKNVRHANKIYRNLRAVTESQAPRRRMSVEDRRVQEALRRKGGQRKAFESRVTPSKPVNEDVALALKVAEKVGSRHVPKRS